MVDSSNTYWCVPPPCFAASQSESCGVCASKPILVILTLHICINQKCFSTQTIVQRRSTAFEDHPLWNLFREPTFVFCICWPTTDGWALCSTPSSRSSPRSSGCSTSPSISCPAVMRRTWQLNMTTKQLIGMDIKYHHELMINVMINACLGVFTCSLTAAVSSARWLESGCKVCKESS